MSRRMVYVVTVVAMLLSLSQAYLHTAGSRAPAQGAAGGYPQVTRSPCRYLMNAPTSLGLLVGPFKLNLYSPYSSTVKKDVPIEVSIVYSSPTFNGSTFTDFAVWAEPAYSAPAPIGHEWGVGPVPAQVTHLGYWVTKQGFSAGSSAFKCNRYSLGLDSVGSYDERLAEILKAQNPSHPFLTRLNVRARHRAAFLWYPDSNALKTHSVKFVGKYKAFNQWFEMETNAIPVYYPPIRQPGQKPFNLNNLIESYSTMAQRAASMTRKMEQAGIGAA